MAVSFNAPTVLAFGSIAATAFVLLFGVLRFKKKKLLQQSFEVMQVAAGYAGYDLADLAHGRSPSPKELVAAIKREHQLLIRRAKNLFARLPESEQQKHKDLFERATALLDSILEDACSGRQLTQEEASRVAEQLRSMFMEDMLPLVMGFGEGGSTELADWTIEATEWASVALIFGDGKTSIFPGDPGKK